ncbi:MAG: divergent polysaccharide deacetylase family protein [Pseudomonadota bacterium]
MGKGLLSGLFWGGAASMILLVAASLYFPLRDLNDAMTQGPVSGERSLLADPPQVQPGAELQETAPDLATAPEAGADDAGQSQRMAGSVPETTPPTAPALRDLEDVAPEALAALPASPESDTPLAVISASPEAPEPLAPSSEAPDIAGIPTVAITGAPDGGTPALPVPAADGDDLPVALPPLSASQPVLRAEAPAAAATMDGDRKTELRLPAMSDQGSGILRPDTMAAPPEDSAAPRAPEVPPRAVPEIGSAPETPRLAEPSEATPPRVTQATPPAPSLAPGDLPLPPVAPRAIATPLPPAPFPRDASEAPPTDPAALPVAIAPQQETPPAAARNLPRRLLLDGAERFAMAGPGISGRIPRIGDPVPPPVETPRAETGAPVGALTRNGQQFAVPDSASVISILVEAPGSSGVETERLAASRLPLSIAIDPSLPDAASLASDLRGAGHDVLITLTGLPGEPEPRDIDIALGAHIARLPEAVGVWLPAGSPVLQDRLLLRHLSEVLSETGHGLVAPGDGLDAALQEARRAGVPAAASSAWVSAQDPLLLRRTLDRVALRARTGQGGLVQATFAPELLEVLSGWSSTLPQTDVAVAPVSAYLQRSAP